jgi:hypothetical protein
MNPITSKNPEHPSIEEARKTQKEMVRELYEDYYKLPAHEQARKIAHALFATGHNEHLPRDEMLSHMSLLSGTAVATLLDCAKKLEAKDEEGPLTL